MLLSGGFWKLKVPRTSRNIGSRKTQELFEPCHNRYQDSEKLGFTKVVCNEGVCFSNMLRDVISTETTD